MKTQAWLKIGLAVIIIVLLYLWLRPQHVEREYESVIYSNDTKIVKNTGIRLTGETIRGLLLFTKSTFSGTLTVDGDLYYKVKLKDSGGYYLGVLTDFNADSSTRTTGVITASKKLDRFWITLTDLDKRYGLGHDEGNISGPASTLEEAKQVRKDILAAHRP
ncbi:hypothetical protein [Paenibacillus graminis]|uniref:hypothetical protein n=1 Tax=Paenibacillus graminis TaxID=189425 RepID=UPI002DBD850D|nr:hypothetical protein [Paenibacillus graminis]MEC0170397.1 hypothetical protein [Paenibacillus graminis]